MWKLPTPDRLAAWKRFRSELDKMDFESALEHTARLWNRAPFNPYYLDHDQIDTWPDPWTLIADNCYCDLAKALGMLYTIHLSEHRTHALELKVFKHKETRAMYNLVWIDNGKYVLNLEPEEFVNKKSIPKELEVKINFSSIELKLDRY
jgi:hypothetical protein